jgi:hypothetical protein
MQKKSRKLEHDEEFDDQLQGQNRNAGKKLKGENKEKKVSHSNNNEISNNILRNR